MILTPTLDIDIQIKEAEISSNKIHSLRAQYISTVQPMKDELRNLILQNETIKYNNKVLIDAEPLTVEQLEAIKEKKIASEIGSKYTISEQILMLLSLQTGEALSTDTNIIEWKNTVQTVKDKYPEV